MFVLSRSSCLGFRADIRFALNPSAMCRLHSLAGSGDNAFDDFSHEVAFCFPGQGAQYVGMCKDVVEAVPKAAELFETASSILGLVLPLLDHAPRTRFVYSLFVSLQV